MLRAGLIRKLGAGIYDYLPLGLRSLRKAMQIVREEMDAAGAVEVLLPTLAPIDLWEKTGRRIDYGQNLFVVKGPPRPRGQHWAQPTKRSSPSCSGAYVESYKQLPLTLYQIQTKFRDEFRPTLRDPAIARVPDEGRLLLPPDHGRPPAAWTRGTGVNTTPTAASSPAAGYPTRSSKQSPAPSAARRRTSSWSPSPTGEDLILKSDSGNYAANVEKCEIGPRPRKPDLDSAPTGDLEKVHTPDCAAIDDVAAFFKKQLKTKLKPQNMLKTLVCKARGQMGLGCRACRPRFERSQAPKRLRWFRPGTRR